MNPTLRYGDGFGNKTPALRGDVERLQRLLSKAGFDVRADGLFGRGTEKAVKKFQAEAGLVKDGIVGPATWRALDSRSTRPRHRAVTGMESFRGDLAWIHEREGHAGKPYWPGGRSGVTLDPGFDLAHQSLASTKELYDRRITAAQYRAVNGVIGVSGRSANEALTGDATLRSIRISRSIALGVMPHVAVKYWGKIARRFAGLAGETTPASVQTALLSLAYNRGAGNRELAPLEEPIRRGKWLKVASVIGSMQQDHALQGIRVRRRMEADLIRAEMTFT